MTYPEKTIGELFPNMTIGGTPSRGDTKYYGGNNLWVSIKDMENQPVVNYTSELITDIGVKNSNCKLVRQGSLLFSFKLTVGRISFAGRDLYTNEAIASFTQEDAEKHAIDLNYLSLVLPLAALRDTSRNCMGVPLLNKNKIKALKVPFPLIDIQRRIAARLKAQLAEVEKARQAADLQLRDAAALQAAVLKETFTGKGSKSWLRVQLGEVGEVVAGVTLGRSTNGKATRSIPYLRVANVKDGHLDLSDVSTIEATEAEIERLLLQSGDILLTEGGDPDKLGRGTFWNNELEECIHQNHIFRVRFPRESYLPEFIAAQIGSSYGKDYFFAHAKKTTGIATINQQVLKSFPVLSPPLNIQKNIMAVLNSKLMEIDKMTKSLRQQLQDINDLPRKILAQAFEG